MYPSLKIPGKRNYYYYDSFLFQLFSFASNQVFPYIIHPLAVMGFFEDGRKNDLGTKADFTVA